MWLPRTGGLALPCTCSDKVLQVERTVKRLRRRPLVASLGAVGRARIVGGTPGGIAFSPGGATLATVGTDGRVLLHDLASSLRPHGLRGHGDPVLALAWAAGDRLVRADRSGSVRTWDATSGRELAAVTLPVQPPGSRSSRCPATAAPSPARSGPAPRPS